MKGPRKYSIEIKASAEKSMLKLPNKAFERSATVILALETDPRPRGCKKLGGRDSFRVRIGNYRVLYIGVSPKRAADSLCCWLRGGVLGETRVEFGLR